MKRTQKREALIVSLAITLIWAAAPKPLAAFFRIAPVLAQSAAPNSSPVGATAVRIDSSSSMAVTNQTFTQRLKQRAPGTEVKVDYQGSDAALRSLQDGKTDLAAIGRPLTAEEKANSFVVVPQSRHKIAIIVGSNNPFTGNLTFEQFAKIFRGEITNWSEVGGQPGPIQLVDRPDSDDTRRALQTYAVFKQAPFQAAKGALKLTQDDTAAMTRELGTRGISYAIADQVTDKPGVRIVPMHKTLPSDPRYPFSQPLAYVYKGKPTLAAQAFLGGAAPANPVIATPATPAVIAPSPIPAPAQAPVQKTDYSWLPWLFLLPVLGGLLWWLLKNRSQPAITPVATTTIPTPPPSPAPVPAPAIVPVEEPPIKLYEERLVADTTRQKVGDVTIGKHVETEQAQVSVPIETERVVIERIAPTDLGASAPEADFREGEVARIVTHEETPDIHKEAFIREEVSVRKEVEHNTVEAEATVRKEKLDINTDGAPVVDNRGEPR